MVIRSLQPEDTNQLASIEEELFTQPWSETAFLELTRKAYCHYLVAEEDGRILGCVGMVVLGDEADVDKVMVAGTHQGRHICQELFAALFEAGERLGVQAYTLEVRKSNEKAIHIYEKLGFISEGIRPGFYDKPKEDAVIMWKRIP